MLKFLITPSGYKLNYAKILCLLLFCTTGTFKTAMGQAARDAQWERLSSAYRSGTLQDTVYMNRVDALELSFDNNLSLKDRLKTYQDIAWSRLEYIPYRIKYFTYLANEAAYTNKWGVSVFYLEKREEEIKKQKPYINSLSVAKQKYLIYGRSPLGYTRSREDYRQHLPFLESVPGLVDNNNAPRRTCLNAMAILYAQAAIYSYGKDTLSLTPLTALAERIYNSVMRKGDRYAPLEDFQLCRYMIRYLEHLTHNKPEEARQQLQELYRIVASSTKVDQAWKQSATLDIYRNLAELFLSYPQNDSAAKYLNLSLDKQKEEGINIGDDSYYLLNFSRLKANKGDYKGAYEGLQKAYNINDSLIALETADIHNNLYAQTVAENKTRELKALEQVTQRRNIWIGITILIFILVIAALLLRLYRKEKEIRQRIKALNDLTRIEIAELEAKANVIQRKLGMELHDDIAGQLAYLCNYIDVKVLKEMDVQQAEQLRSIGDIAREAYQRTRSKSHDWYSEGQKEELASFSESIHKLITYALPDGKYEKVISIDEQSLIKVPHATRIELLRIVQESVANVLKHADADKVSLFLYEEDHATVLQIKDNGKGFDTAKKKPEKKLGLQSIHDRINDLKGSLEIFSSRQGTELLITVPVM